MEPTGTGAFQNQADLRVDADMDTEAVSWNEQALKEAAGSLATQSKLGEAQTPCQTLADDEEDEEDAPEIKNNALFSMNPPSAGAGGEKNFMDLLSSKLQKEADEDMGDWDEVDDEMDEEEMKRREDFEKKMSSKAKGGLNK